MKKAVHPLRLSRETLLHLNQGRLHHAAAAAARAVGGAQMSQEGDSCLQSCYLNTCYDGCIWPTQAGLN